MPKKSRSKKILTLPRMVFMNIFFVQMIYNHRFLFLGICANLKGVCKISQTSSSISNLIGKLWPCFLHVIKGYGATNSVGSWRNSLYPPKQKWKPQPVGIKTKDPVTTMSQGVFMLL